MNTTPTRTEAAEGLEPEDVRAHARDAERRADATAPKRSSVKKPVRVAAALLVAAELTLVVAGFALGKSAVVLATATTGTAHAAPTKCCEAKPSK